MLGGENFDFNSTNCFGSRPAFPLRVVVAKTAPHFRILVTFMGKLVAIKRLSTANLNC